MEIIEWIELPRARFQFLAIKHVLICKPMRQLNLVNHRFGRWVVLHKTTDIQRFNYKEAVWLCRCDCGTEREVRSRVLLHKTQNSRSCGCARTDTMRENPSRLKHGYSKSHRLYPTWKTMRQRCMNPNNKKYPRYGGRGIYVCKRWDNFKKFLIDMGKSWKEGLSLDRINNDGPYSPLNCRWATPLEQAHNKGLSKFLVLKNRGYTDEDLIHWEDLSDIVDAIKNLLKIDDINSTNIEFYQILGKYRAVFSYEIKD